MKYILENRYIILSYAQCRRRVLENHNFFEWILREYKEALKQQRANEGPSVYRPREQVTPPGNESQNNEADPNINKEGLALTGKQIFNEENALKRPVQKVTPSRINYQNTPIINGSNSEYNNKNGKYLDQPYKKPSSPIKTSSSILSTNASPAHAPRLVKTAVGYVEGNTHTKRVKQERAIGSHLERILLLKRTSLQSVISRLLSIKEVSFITYHKKKHVEFSNVSSWSNLLCSIFLMKPWLHLHRGNILTNTNADVTQFISERAHLQSMYKRTSLVHWKFLLYIPHGERRLCCTTYW